MVEAIVVIVGMIITFIPALIFAHYMFTHAVKKTRFDYHLEIVKDRKGNFGVVLAYIERVLFGITICSLGILMSDFFSNEEMLTLFVISLVVYIIVKYFDEKNEK